MRRRLQVLTLVMMAACLASLSACGKKEDTSAKGYYDGPMQSKGATGKTPGGGPPAGNPP